MTPDRRSDTNSLWLTSQLNALGVEACGASWSWVTIANCWPQAVRDSLAHVSIVILSGGLGPTEDDVTRAMLSPKPWAAT